MIRDSILADLVQKQTDLLNRNASQEELIEVYEQIKKRQKELRRE
jgi:hypothetical protein